MNFRPGTRDEPEINLIPFIDILLVVLIFLVLTTTYSKYTELQVNLPTADAEKPQSSPREVVVSVGKDGRFAVNRLVLDAGSVDALVAAIGEAARDDREAMVIISADAAASHQSVIHVMDAARRAGLSRITFATQQGGSGAARARP
jgi:biopolymer transport protein ExbD